MASFSKMTEDNRVIGTHAVDDADAPTEAAGQAFLESVHGWPAHLWKQTYKDGSQRKNYAGTGMIYDPARDAFLSSKPFPSWVLNEDSCRYEAPSALPADAGDQEDGTRNRYRWNEATTSWSKAEGWGTVIPPL